MKRNDSAPTATDRLRSSAALQTRNGLIAPIALYCEVVGARDVRIRLGVDASPGDGNGRQNDHA
jgi:hypothetical protein